MKKKNNVVKIVVFVLIVAVLLAAYFWYQKTPGGVSVSSKYSIDNITTFQVLDSSLDDFTVDKYYKEFTERKDIFLANQAEPLVAFDPLLKMGLLKQLVKDYKGAEEIWLYTYDLKPNSYILTGDLAHLYQYFIPDYTKSEQFYLETLAFEDINPLNQYNYFSELHDLYRFRMNDQEKAQAVLDQAIEALPNDINVYLRAANYYKDMKNVEQAEYYYKEALKINPNSLAAKQGLEKLSE